MANYGLLSVWVRLLVCVVALATLTHSFMSLKQNPWLKYKSDNSDLAKRSKIIHLVLISIYYTANLSKSISPSCLNSSVYRSVLKSVRLAKVYCTSYLIQQVSHACICLCILGVKYPFFNTVNN